VKNNLTFLWEDSSQMYNKWVSGIAKRDLQPELITVADIVNRFRNNSQAPKTFPFPLENLLNLLGDIFIQCANTRRLLASSFSNPVIKDDSGKIKAIRELNAKMDKIQNELIACTDALNKLVD